MIGSCQFNSKQEGARENIMPEISVIVPVYNTEKHLMRCVKSIVDQTYTDFELILVDDGSSDGSPEICDEWTERDCRIHVTHKKKMVVRVLQEMPVLQSQKGNGCFFLIVMTGLITKH